MDPLACTHATSTTAGFIVHENGHSHIQNFTSKIYEAPKPLKPLPKRIEYNVQDPIQSFTGREEVLEQLHKAIMDNKSTDKVTVLSQIKAITGMGGLGKTQTVRRYILKHKGEFGHLLYINAENYSIAKDCFQAIASKCHISYENFDSRRAEILEQIYDYVCTGEKPCLIVFDNAESMGRAESEEGIKPFLPASIKPGWQKPAILVTSRNPVWEGAGSLIKLSGLSDKECFDLLTAHLKLTDTPENRECAKRITDMCEGLPLVVQQVVAIIRLITGQREPLGESAYTMEDFLREVKQDRLDFTNTEPVDSPVRSTAFQIFKLAFQRLLEQENGGTAFRCLSVMAWLNPDNISAKLLTALIAPVTTDKTILTRALNMLRDQNLVTLHNGSYRIHRIVQLVCIRYSNNNCAKAETGWLLFNLKYLWKAIRGTPEVCLSSSDILTSIIPPFLDILEKTRLNEDSLNGILQNGLVVASHLKQHSEVDGNIGFLKALAEKLEAAGKFSEEENIRKVLLAIHESGKGTSADKRNTKLDLAWACHNQGKNDAALKISIEVLETWEAELGPSHEGILRTKEMMASFYQRQGKYDDAIELQESVLKNREIKFGSSDSRTAVIKHNLANTLKLVGKYERAMELYNDALKYKELQLGPNHQSTLLTKHNLAELLQKLGKYDEAVKMYEDTLRRRENELGRNHIDTLTTKRCLADALKDKGEHQRAFQLYEEILNAQMTHFGPSHINTLHTKNNFALLHLKLGNYDTAVEMQEDVLERREKVLGLNHPHTIVAKKNLANTLRAKGENERASEL